MTLASSPTCPTTEAVRSMYEAFPYPSDATPRFRHGSDSRVVLSLGRLSRGEARPPRILDAGCGRGVGLVATAVLHPKAEVLGIDLCEHSLADARAEADALRLRNVRVQQVDLMTLEGLEVPPGGFDVIHSSGVVHHLPDPQIGLRRLAKVLAPGGVVVFMVYGTIGRRRVKRVMRALAAWLPAEADLPRKLELARHFVGELADASDPLCPWRAAASCPDAEFVDRYLHPQETDYDVPGLFDLVEGAGLRFLRWCEPAQWTLDGHLDPGPLRDSIEALPERERYAAIEQIVRPGNLQAYLCRPENGPRELPPLESWDRLLLAVSSEVQLDLGRTNLWGGTLPDSIAFRLRGGEPLPVPAGPVHDALQILATQNEPFRGATLVEALAAAGHGREVALATLAELVRLELVYAPHEAELY